MDTTYKPQKSITTVLDETRKKYKEVFGELLTEEEAIRLTDEIREEIKKEKKL